MILGHSQKAGRLRSGEENRFRTIFDTVYEPGEVKAIAYYADGTTETFSLQTADHEVGLAVQTDKVEIAPYELAYVTIQLEDTSGILHTAADRNVKVSVEGAGCMQGFGSADPYSEEDFFYSERITYYGRALAVIRAGGTEGTIIVKAEAEGVEPVSIEIHVR